MRWRGRTKQDDMVRRMEMVTEGEGEDHQESAFC